MRIAYKLEKKLINTFAPGECSVLFCLPSCAKLMKAVANGDVGVVCGGGNGA